MKFVFIKEYREAFNAFKLALCTAPILAHYHPNRETRIETDSLDIVITGVLSQKGFNGEWHPIAYFSKTMNSAECSYKIHGEELLAIVTRLKDWRAVRNQSVDLYIQDES